VEIGRYAKHLKRFREAFPVDQIMVLLLGELNEDPQGTLSEDGEFLDIEGSKFELDALDRIHNPHAQPLSWAAHKVRHNVTLHHLFRLVFPSSIRTALKNAWARVLLRPEPRPSVGEEARVLLKEVYTPELDELEDMIGERADQLREEWTRR